SMGVVQVQNDAGTSAGGPTFKVTPKLTLLSPTSGIRTSSVVITGTTFVDVTAVKFGAVAATTYTGHNPPKIPATVPGTAAAGNITVTTVARTSTALPFTVIQGPSVSGLSPSSGQVGTVVTVNGSTLAGATAVTFGGMPASVITPVNASSLKATVPAGASMGVVQVQNDAGTSAGGPTFKVTPKLTLLSPTSGIRTSSVVITGT